MCISHLGVFLISVKPLTTKNTEIKATPNICKNYSSHQQSIYFLLQLMSAPPETTTAIALGFVSTTLGRSAVSAQVDLLNLVWSAAEVILSSSFFFLGGGGSILHALLLCFHFRFPACALF